MERIVRLLSTARLHLIVLVAPDVYAGYEWSVPFVLGPLVVCCKIGLLDRLISTADEVQWLRWCRPTDTIALRPCNDERSQPRPT